MSGIQLMIDGVQWLMLAVLWWRSFSTHTKDSTDEE